MKFIGIRLQERKTSEGFRNYMSKRSYTYFQKPQMLQCLWLGLLVFERVFYSVKIR